MLYFFAASSSRRSANAGYEKQLNCCAAIAARAVPHEPGEMLANLGERGNEVNMSMYQGTSSAATEEYAIYPAGTALAPESPAAEAQGSVANIAMRPGHPRQHK